MSVGNKGNHTVTFQDTHQRPSISQHSVSRSGILMTSSRQEFIPGEPNGGIKYGRNGGVFISKWGIFSLILAVIILTTIVGLLVYFFAPCRDEEKAVVEDDLSWNIGELHRRTSDDTLRLMSNVRPSYYRLKIKPNFTTFTFEGKVSITLSTNKTSVKHIALHAKNLEILNGTVLTEQNTITMQISKPKTKRQIGEDSKNASKNVVPLTVENPTNASDKGLNLTEMFKSSNSTDNPVTNQTEPQIKPPVLLLSKSKRMKIVSQELNPSIDRLVFTLDSHIKAFTNYTLEINFKGKIDDSLKGFYRSTYSDSKNSSAKSLAVTQFEPTSARKAFPCFDEPEYKAMFEISIARNETMKVLSNMPLLSEEQDPDDKSLIWSHFERSVPMSPYLVAYVISELESLPVTNNNTWVKYNIWARKEFLSQTTYAIEIVPKILNFFESYFGIPYALPKMDLVAIPDFAVGAMENWGLVTFSETSLLLNPEKVAIRAKKQISRVIAHEIAHQWFGNLVTMRWWNDLWLNEGFATLMEFLCVNDIQPDWELMDEFTWDRMQVMIFDSIQSTRAVSASVNDETQINQIFDEISYMKAASLLNMLNHVLSKEVFQQGLISYMNEWKFKNAEGTDLWNSFPKMPSNGTGLSDKLTVTKFMESWTSEPGYPVIYVNRNYTDMTATISQRRFYLYKPTTGVSEQLWYVPLTYAVGGTNYTDWSTMPRDWLEKTHKTTITLPDSANNTWVYFNVHSIGHYRVNYDNKNWKLLEFGLFDDPEDFPPVTKAQLLDDAFNLAKAGHLNYSVPLDLTKYMKGIERHYLPWVTVLDNLNLIHQGMQRTSQYGVFQEYISSLIMPTLEEIGFDPKTNESSQDMILRDRLIYWACLVEEPKCLEWVKKQFDNWMNQSDPDTNNPIPSNNRVTVYTTSIRMGSKKEFDFLFERLNKSRDPEVISEITATLPSTRNTWQLYNLLEYSLTTMDTQKIPILWGGFESDLASQLAFKYVCGNWERIYKRYADVDDSILQAIIDGAFNNIATEQELRQYKRFITANKEQLSSASNVIKRNLEGAVLRIQWAKTKVGDIIRWLQRYSYVKKSMNHDYITLYDNYQFHRRDYDLERLSPFNHDDKSVIPLYMG